MTTVYFAGGEDIEHYAVGGGLVSTTANTFRSTTARCSLQAVGVTNVPTWISVNTWNSAPITSFWWTGRVQASTLTSNGSDLMQLLDINKIVRLRFTAVSNGPNVWQMNKKNAAGTSTQLGSNFNWSPTGSSSQDKIDIFVNYAVSGTLTVYANNVQIFTFSGDVTTDSVTGLGNHGLGTGGASGGRDSFWSEIVCLDTDTRAISLQTLAPVANGNTHNFDTGTPTAANVNETTLNDATLDGSTTAAQIDEYTIPVIVSGTYSIVAVGVSARLQKGTSGPTKADLVLRSGTTDYLSADQSLTAAWANYQNWWLTDPNTSAAWTALPVNIGIKSIT